VTLRVSTLLLLLLLLLTMTMMMAWVFLQRITGRVKISPRENEYCETEAEIRRIKTSSLRINAALSGLFMFSLFYRYYHYLFQG